MPKSSSRSFFSSFLFLFDGKVIVFLYVCVCKINVCVLVYVRRSQAPTPFLFFKHIRVLPFLPRKRLSFFPLHVPLVSRKLFFNPQPLSFSLFLFLFILNLVRLSDTLCRNLARTTTLRNSSSLCCFLLPLSLSNSFTPREWVICARPNCEAFSGTLNALSFYLVGSPSAT